METSADLIARTKRVATLIAAANELDALGQRDEADKLTRLAEKEKGDIEIAADEAGETPLAIERQLGSLYAKIAKMIDNPTRFQKRLNELCEQKNCKVEARKLRNCLEEAADLLAPFKA